MEPSELEIRREVEALRDIRRRSTSQGGPGSLPLDPDLPNAPPSPPSPLSPQTWAQGASPGGQVSQDDEDMVLADPSHLFWVPAHLHPELAPAEFRAFLQQHAQTPAPAGSEAGSSRVGRSSSLRSASSLNRRRSMLSRQYEPKAGDGVEKEEENFQRKRSITFRQQSPQLSINDLQKLEELAEEAQRSDDPSKLRSVLRRSLSLNVSPSKLDDRMPDVEDADAPIIVPKPGQILRRAARTKIRKPSLQGDGGGHRFPATRRTQRSATLDSLPGSTPPSEEVQRRTTPTQDDPYPRPHAPMPDGDDDEAGRPVSFSEESLIFDSYADRPDSYTSLSEEDGAAPSESTSPPPPLPPAPVVSPPPPPAVIAPSPIHEEPEPLPLHHPTPQRMLSVPNHAIQPQRSPSPSSSDGGHGSYQTLPASPSPPPGKKEKKGGLFKWGSSKDKESKKAKHQHQQQEYAQSGPGPAPPQKEKDSGGFFGFFGKKKADEGAGSGTLGSGAGPAAAAALLGPPKSAKPSHSQKHSLQYGPGTLAQQGGPGYDAQIQYAGHYARYPIHVERAVYRLSHIKLANPRRPLYEQVLISNLMFWYLGVINKQQQAAAAAQMQMQQQAAAGPATEEEQQRREAEEREREAREQEELAQRERERMEWEQQQREREAEEQAAALLEQQQREEQERAAAAAQPTRTKSGRRPLTKAVPGARRAETPVRGPQYDAQHRVISQEQWDALGIGLSASDQSHPALSFFEQPKEPVAGLPPGAMSPAHAQEQARRPQRPRSPPASLQQQAAGVSRSLSASAVTPPAANGRPRRKANSAIAARAGAPGPGWKQDDEDERFFGAEEDVPLAVWQQQQQQQQRAGRR